VSPEGWIVTLAFSALALSSRQRKLSRQWAWYAIVVGFLAVALLKGAAPGGARARADFDAATAAS
jgi:hypothetical protein